MAVPKRRVGKARRDRRRAQWARRTKKPNVTRCPNCEEPKLSHRVCMKCGHYDGQEVVAVPEEAAE